MSHEEGGVVNIIPFSRIKKEVTMDDDVVNCKTCWKGFASQLALNNHVRMEHMDLYATGDPTQWTHVIEQPTKESMDVQSVLKEIKKEKVVFEMSPSKGGTEEVSYIIVKTDEYPQNKRQKKEPKKKEDRNSMRREPITGPFECLQPSNLVADGTCHQIFFSCCAYSIHFRDEHNRRRKGVRCQVCEKPLALAGETPTSAYPCEICGAGYETARELSDHTAVAHIKLKPFECGVCQKRFTQQGGLMQHMRMHTGDRPFPCTFCPKAFTQKSGLEQHLRIHTKVKPYRCIVCSKAFAQSVHLKQHMRTHTNVSPFQCGICEKRFKQSSHLNYHLKNHNPATMTEEQKTKFNELIGIMNSDMVKLINGEDAIPVEYNDETQETVEYEEIGNEDCGENEEIGNEDAGENQDEEDEDGENGDEMEDREVVEIIEIDEGSAIEYDGDRVVITEVVEEGQAVQTEVVETWEAE